MKTCLYSKIFAQISEILESSGIKGYVIGGWVRDCLLKRNADSKDVDIVVDGDGIEAARNVATGLKKGTRVTIYRNFGTAMFKIGKWQFEFVGARKESYNRDSRNPMVLTGTIEDDQRRRDFTINALALGLNRDNFGELVDPFNGIDDLKRKLIRTPLDPVITFSDDPLRMMRAIRFATQLNFKIQDKTFEAIKRQPERIGIVSMERIMVEFNKILLSPIPSKGIILMDKAGLTDQFFPELSNLKGVEKVGTSAHKDNFRHTLKVLDKLSLKSEKLWLRWAALLHDIAKPVTRKYIEGSGWTFHGHEFIGSKMVPVIFKRLKLPMGSEMKYVRKMVLLHLRPIILSQKTVTDSAIRRLLFEAGDDIDDLMKLCESDITSKNETKVKLHLRNFGIVRNKLVAIEEKDHIRNFQPPVSGSEIMDIFQLKPGKMVGILKNAVKEAILEGEIRNDRREAIKFILSKASELGLKPPAKNHL